MTDPMQTIRDDLTYLRALAEDGRDGGSKGGGVMLAAGIIWSSCSMVQWAALTGRVGETAASVAWIVGAVLFFAAMILLLRRTAKPTGGARASGLAWAGVSWAIFTLFAAIALATWRTHDPLLIRFFPSIILAVYGAAWSVGAAVFQARWMRLTCIGSFAAAIVCAWFIADPAQYLIYAAALILLAALPGVVLLRQDQSRALLGA